MERQWMTLDQIKVEYTSNDYNPELLLQHLLRHVEASPASVPEGYVFVPVEPTSEMWAAVNKLDDEMAAGGHDGKGCSIEQAWNCLIAAAPTPPVSEDRWLPIETAPKDGSEFVTCNTNQGGVKELVSWNIFHGFWQSKGASIHMQATYWMPLPKAPAMQEGKP